MTHGYFYFQEFACQSVSCVFLLAGTTIMFVEFVVLLPMTMSLGIAVLGKFKYHLRQLHFLSEIIYILSFIKLCLCNMDFKNFSIQMGICVSSGSHS